MLHSLVLKVVIFSACAFDALLFFELINDFSLTGSVHIWATLHVICILIAVPFLLLYFQQWRPTSLISAGDVGVRQQPGAHSLRSTSEGAQSVTQQQTPPSALRLVVLLAVIGLAVPGVGLAAALLALVYAMHAEAQQNHEPDYWQCTEPVKLPWHAPVGRSINGPDSRGFTEHMIYSKDSDDVYSKVLAAARVRSSLSIKTLKMAMQHSDERVRLTAYKTLDRKVTALNKQIQRLEAEVVTACEYTRADTWLQVASSYWELLTLEGDEAIARQQLLNKAAAAASNAVRYSPQNRNAHFVLGQVLLARRDIHQACTALTQAIKLGMPYDKVLPYLAECAWVDRDFSTVQQLLSHLDPSMSAYPPLSDVTEFWV